MLGCFVGNNSNLENCDLGFGGDFNNFLVKEEPILLAGKLWK